MPGAPFSTAGPLYGLRLITRQLTGTLATMITVDGQTISESLAAVETALNPVLAELPTVQTISERQQVIRYGNRSLTDQLRTGLTHGRSDGGNRAVERNFDCECGAIECTAMVRLRPADAILLAERPPGAICLCSHATR